MCIKFFLSILFLFLFHCTGMSQSRDNKPDSLHWLLTKAVNDTVRMETLYKLSVYHSESNRDSAMFFIEASMEIARKMDQQLYLVAQLMLKSYLLQKQANFTHGLRLCNEALAISEQKENEKGAYIPQDNQFRNDPSKYRYSLLIGIYHQMGNIYSGTGDLKKAIEYFQREIQVADEIGEPGGRVTSNMNIGSIYAGMNQPDSAFTYAKRALENVSITGWRGYEGFILEDIGLVYFNKGIFDSAKIYLHQAISVNNEQHNLAGEIAANTSMATLYEKLGIADSILFYATRGYQLARQLDAAKGITTSTEQIATAWRLNGNSDSALAYLMVSKKIGDSLYKNFNKKVTEFQQVSFEEQMQLEKQAQESITARNRIKMMALLGGLGLLAVLALVFFRNFRQRQRSYRVLEKTLTDLKATQVQLIHSEKMASLGELTAGIAHEIQNPLNFVNNFSEVNTELIDEMKEEFIKGNTTEAVQLAEDIKQNNEKISFHGKRADSIVKGMLQHSRNSSGQKELTDINNLADECLRLSYHGFRAKDHAFNSNTETHFEEGLPDIQVAPQDIGRVLLNLITNSFYSVALKRKEADDGYEPMIEVSTKNLGNAIEISVRDNGNGVPQKVLDKIFQPFFTTKPTGEGTGLGLSMSYEIITKGHGGQLVVDTKEGAYAEFRITLPFKH